MQIQEREDVTQATCSKNQVVTGGVEKSNGENKVLEVKAGVEVEDEGSGLGGRGRGGGEDEYLGSGPVVCRHLSGRHRFVFFVLHVDGTVDAYKHMQVRAASSLARSGGSSTKPGSTDVDNNDMM